MIVRLVVGQARSIGTAFSMFGWLFPPTNERDSHPMLATREKPLIQETCHARKEIKAKQRGSAGTQSWTDGT